MDRKVLNNAEVGPGPLSHKLPRPAGTQPPARTVPFASRAGKATVDEASLVHPTAFHIARGELHPAALGQGAGDPKAVLERLRPQKHGESFPSPPPPAPQKDRVKKAGFLENKRPPSKVLSHANQSSPGCQQPGHSGSLQETSSATPTLART